MKDRKPLHIYNYIYISILALIIILAPKAVARFTSNKKHDGNINIKNHPCKGELGSGARYILDKEGGLDFIRSKPTPDFSKVANTKEGMFMSEDDCGESYYFRGVSDNWVSFAGFYWRIIRINGDGSIRLIYSGTKENNTGDATQVGTSAYNTRADQEKYADYKISTIKTRVDNWYKTNILDKGYDNKIADTGYCNDMSKKTPSYFGAYDRLRNNKTPTLKCPDKASDLLSKGNNKLTYPVGLLTLDEGSFAGGATNSSNKNYYLYTGEGYWTMTPAWWSGDRIIVGGVDFYDGYLLHSGSAYNSNGVRPVLSLKSDVIITTGDGTLDNPYIVS